MRGALAGAVAAAVWAAQEPLDRRVFGVPYSDVELLGRWVEKDRWREAGWALHVANGAVFGELYRLTPLRGAGGGLLAGLTEHLATWPATRFVPVLHPRGRKLPKLYGNRPAFWQAVWRHALFGIVLGALESRDSLDPAPA